MSNNIQQNNFNFLLNNSNIGFYNKCEVIEIFGFNVIEKEIFNIYTLIVFEDTKQINTDEMLTKKLETFQSIKNIKWGIKRSTIDIDTAETLYNTLINENKFKIDSKEVLVGQLKYLDMQYVQSNDSFIKPQLNYIIKNNFHNGSYVLEFFDEEKENNNFLLNNPVLLSDFSKKVNEIIPINIASLSDRLGNIIFQFPINVFKLDSRTIQQGNPNRYSGLNIEIIPNHVSYNIQNLEIRVFEQNDNLISRQHNKVVQTNITKILLDDCYGTTIEIIDKNTSLLLYKNKFSIFKDMNFQMNLISPQNRVFELNGRIQKIQVQHNTNNTIGNNVKNKEFYQWTADRKYEQELKYLEEDKSFIQYYGKKDEDKKALEDIKFLINTYGGNGVYLWDPYLSAIDIKNTLYFSKSSYIKLKAITGLKQGSSYVTNIIRTLKWSTDTYIVNKVILLDFQYHLNIFYNKSQKQQAISELELELNKDKKQFLFLNLEVRGKHGTNGYDFHDRFLIFPQEKPKVWSLGISVNQLGKAHHILQEVKNAQHILNAFNQLWDELDKRECLVWKSN